MKKMVDEFQFPETIGDPLEILAEARRLRAEAFAQIMRKFFTRVGRAVYALCPTTWHRKMRAS